MVYVITNQPILHQSPNWVSASMDDVIEYLKNVEEVALDSETTGFDPHTDKMLYLQLGDVHNQYFIDHTTVDISPLKPLLESKLIIGQNLKFDLKFLYKNNIVPRLIYDTFVAEKVIYCGDKLHRCGLDALSERYCGEKMDKTIRKDIAKLGMTDEVIEYSVNDIRFLQIIKSKQEELLKERDLMSVMGIENRFTPALAYIEYCGFKLDVNRWKAKMLKDQQILDDAEKKLDSFVIDNLKNLHGGKFISKQLDLFEPATCAINWASPKQVIELFEAEGINCDIVEKGVHKKSVEANVLKNQEKNFPIITLYLEYKKAQKVVSTYGQGFIDKINKSTGRIHTNFNQILVTGRISSGGKNRATGEEYINFQNIPSDKETRSCFVAEPGNMLIVSDYSGQEQIVLANRSLDRNLLDFYDKGLGDMHSFVASKMYPELEGLSVDDIKENHKPKRQAAKISGLAINYGGVGATIAEQMGISIEEGNTIYDAYFSVFPGLKDYFKQVHRQALRDGYHLINPITGRKSFIVDHKRYLELKDEIDWDEYREEKAKKSERYLYLKKVVSDLFYVKGNIERDAQNFPIQGTSADIVKISIIYIYEWIVNSGYFGTVLFPNTVHDENILECPIDMADEVADKVEEFMKMAGEHFCKRVPLVAIPEKTAYWKK